jgi:hypothetical protein
LLAAGCTTDLRPLTNRIAEYLIRIKGGPFGVQRLQIQTDFALVSSRCKHLGGAVDQLYLSLRDLILMRVRLMLMGGQVLGTFVFVRRGVSG